MALGEVQERMFKGMDLSLIYKLIERCVNITDMDCTCVIPLIDEEKKKKKESLVH